MRLETEKLMKQGEASKEKIDNTDRQVRETIVEMKGMGKEIAEMSKNFDKIGDLGEKISNIDKKLVSIEDKVNKPANANATRQ